MNGRGNGAGPPGPAREAIVAAPSGFVDEKLMKALSHPIRVKLLAALCERPATFGRLVEIVAQPSSRANYHLRELLVADLVVAEAQRGRGKLYRARTAAILPAGVWDDLPEGIRHQLGASIFRLLYADAAASMAARRFGPGTHLSLTPMVVDPEGAADVTALLERTVAGLLAIQAESSARMNRAREAGHSMTVALAGFESVRRSAERVTAAQAVRL